MIELHHAGPTADSLKLLIALNETGLTYEGRDVDPARAPVLIVDGEPMTDSQFALEYLAEACQPRFAPSSAAGWYDVQAWTAQLDQALGASVRLLGDGASSGKAAAGWDQVTSDAEASEDQLALARDKIGAMVQRIETALRDSDWLVGGAYSVADMNGFALTHTLPRLTPELVSREKTPNLVAWLDRIGGREAVKAALATGRQPGQDAHAPAL